MTSEAHANGCLSYRRECVEVFCSGYLSLYANALGVAIAQSTYATDEGGEIAALRTLLEHVELEGLLVQADALHANRPFFSTSRGAALTS